MTPAEVSSNIYHDSNDNEMIPMTIKILLNEEDRWSDRVAN